MPSATPDLAQVEAAAFEIFPKGPSLDCFTGTFERCPFTPRLIAQMQTILKGMTAGGADPVCRCQNSYMSSSVTTEIVSGQPVAHVVLTFGESTTIKMNWVFVESGGKWLADDSYCTAQGPSTSIYMGLNGPCSG